MTLQSGDNPWRAETKLMSQVPEDSVLRRHYQQLQDAAAATSKSSSTGAGASPNTGATTAARADEPEKGFFGRLLDKLFGG